MSSKLFKLPLLWRIFFSSGFVFDYFGKKLKNSVEYLRKSVLSLSILTPLSVFYFSDFLTFSSLCKFYFMFFL